jgi:hypothetical protein
LIVLGVLSTALAAAKPDLDRDGLPDQLEQALLDRFAPELILAAGECDLAPAEMTPGFKDPVALARNGVIYGQAFRKNARTIELHYFHLWTRDCGRAGHALDAEHVSALLEAPRPDAPAKRWQARYWYAAGHQGTVCDSSSGARAAALNATTHGPRVWIAAGKHASYLDAAACAGGCGADRCSSDGARWKPRRIVNLGERETPLNGARWIASRRWNLASKLGTDFPDSLCASLDASPGITRLWPALGPAQSILMLGGELGAAAIGVARRR